MTALAPASQQKLGRSFYAMWLPLMLAATLLGRIKKQRPRHWIACGLFCALLLLQVACGGSSTKTTGPTNYTVTVTGASGAIQHSIQIGVTVE
jgi:hypothetical protein